MYQKLQPVLFRFCKSERHILKSVLPKAFVCLRKFAAIQLPKRGRALQANVVIGIVPQAVAQYGENLGIRRTGRRFRAKSIEEEVDGLDAHTGVGVVLQRPDERLADGRVLL